MPKIPLNEISDRAGCCPPAVPLVVKVQCPICGELVDVDQYLRERACSHAIQLSRYGGLNAAHSLAGMARGLSRMSGIALQPARPAHCGNYLAEQHAAETSAQREAASDSNGYAWSLTP